MYLLIRLQKKKKIMQTLGGTNFRLINLVIRLLVI